MVISCDFSLFGKKRRAGVTGLRCSDKRMRYANDDQHIFPRLLENHQWCNNTKRSKRDGSWNIKFSLVCDEVNFSIHRNFSYVVFSNQKWKSSFSKASHQNVVHVSYSRCLSIRWKLSSKLLRPKKLDDDGRIFQNQFLYSGSAGEFGNIYYGPDDFYKLYPGFPIWGFLCRTQQYIRIIFVALWNFHLIKVTLRNPQ